MGSKLIKLEDGTLVEVEVPENEAQKISGGFAEKVDSKFEEVKPVLLNICRPLTEVWQELNQDMHVEEAEVELGLSFEGQGNLFVTKSKLEANLTVKLKFNPQKKVQ